MEKMHIHTLLQVPALVLWPTRTGEEESGSLFRGEARPERQNPALSLGNPNKGDTNHFQCSLKVLLVHQVLAHLGAKGKEEGLALPFTFTGAGKGLLPTQALLNRLCSFSGAPDVLALGEGE